MNTVRIALGKVQPLVDTGNYWARIITFDDMVYFEAGPLHDNGFEECPTYSGSVRLDGTVVESHRRI